MLITLVKNWAIVKVGQDKNCQFLWGIIVDDQLGRFEVDDYVFTSSIQSICPSKRLVITSSAHTYKLQGDGKRVFASSKELELLRAGYSPSEIKFIESIREKLE